MEENEEESPKEKAMAYGFGFGLVFVVAGFFMLFFSVLHWWIPIVLGIALGFGLYKYKMKVIENG